MPGSGELLEFSVDEAEGAVRDTIALLHGFPDGPAVWSGTSAYLRQRGYRVVRIALPGFESSSAAPPPSFDETVARLRATLDEVGALGRTVIGHDWGAIFGYLLLLQHPDAASRFVALEVGAGPASWTLTAFVLAYHAVLNLVYTIGSVLGPRLGDAVMRLLCSSLPRPAYDGCPEPRARHAWLYRQAWREAGRYGPRWLYFRSSIAQWRPVQPFLFVYGRDGLRALRFHTSAWREAVTSEYPASRSVGIEGSHWCFLEHPEPFHVAVGTFLDESEVDASALS